MKSKIFKCKCGFDFVLSKEIDKKIEVICPKCKKKQFIEPVSTKKGGNY